MSDPQTNRPGWQGPRLHDKAADLSSAPPAPAEGDDRVVKEMIYANSMRDMAARFHAQLARIVEHYEARSELYTNDADCAAGLAGIANEAIQPAPPAPVQQGEGDDLFGRIYQAAVRITGDQEQAHNIANDALSTPEEPAKESPASYADREGKEGNGVSRDHAHTAGVKLEGIAAEAFTAWADAERLRRQRIAEYNAGREMVNTQRRDGDWSGRLDEEYLRMVKATRAANVALRDLSEAVASSQAQAPGESSRDAKQPSPARPTREEVRMVVAEALASEPYVLADGRGRLDVAVDKLLALFPTSEGAGQ